MISKLKETNLAKIISIVLIFAIVTVSCTPSKKTVDIKKVSGEELFKGFMFAEGPVAQMIPEIKRVREVLGVDKLSDSQKKAFRILQDSLIIVMKDFKPSFFKEFKAEMQSGNPKRIDAKLTEAGDLCRIIILKYNRALSPILNTKLNKELVTRLSKVGSINDLRNRIPEKAEELARLNKELKGIPYEINIHKDIITSVDKVRNFDVATHVLDNAIAIDKMRDNDFCLANDLHLNNNVDLALLRASDQSLSKDFATFRLVDMHINNNIQLQLQKAVNSFIDGPADFTGADTHADASQNVDTAAVAWLVIAVAVAIAAVAVLVVMAYPAGFDKEIFNDKGGLLREQMIASISEKFMMR